MSSSLPESGDQDEQDNAQYVELKKLLPAELVEHDVTARSATMVVKRPVGLSSPKTVFEFRSSKQEMQDLGKIDLSSLWHDEETPKDKRGECVMRLLSEDGDEFFSLTATNPYTYTYDEIFNQASLIYRTKTITDKFGGEKYEKKKTGRSIACMFMATDDNPILDKDVVDRIFEDITDPDELAVRRYAVFKQVSGRIFKTYDPSICYIDFNKYFPSCIPSRWVHARGIDYHESRLPWSVGYCPRGAMPTKEMIETVKAEARKQNCIFVKFEPNVSAEGTVLKGQSLQGLSLSDLELRPGKALFTPFTFQVDLTKSEEELLAGMKPKTRYNIRLAEKKGVVVKEDNSDAAFEAFQRLTEETTKRQHFYAHDRKYRKLMWQTMREAGIARMLVARLKEEGRRKKEEGILVTWIIFIFNGVGYYPYGASSQEYRELMASNLVAWRALQLAKFAGCKKFDFWGSLGS